MRQKKIEDDEMLITHLPTPPKDMAGGEGSEETTDGSMDPAVLAARLAAATDPVERARLVQVIQERLGNREATRIIRAAEIAEEP